ncbi:MAG: DUF167 family protein [Thermodesulfobacteriota bacterium]
MTAKGSQQVILNLYVQPKSSRTRVVGLHDGSIKLTITSPPIEGKANAQVTAFMSKLFKIPKSAITLLSGHQGRHKRLAVTGITQDEIRRILTPLLCL